MRKKSVALISLFLVGMIVLSGCGTNGSSTSTSASTSVSTSESTSAGVPAEPYTVKMAILCASEPQDMRLVADKINDLPEVKEANVRFDPLCISFGSWLQQTTLLLSSGEKLDLLPVFSWDANMSSLVAKGQLVPIDDLLEKHGQGIVKVLGDTYAHSCRLNGKYYGVPSLRDMATGFGVTMKKEIVDKYKIDTGSIKTLDDLAAIYAKLHASEPDLAMVSNSVGTYPLTECFGGYYDDLGDLLGVLMMDSTDNKIVNLYEQQIWLDHVKMFRDWYLKGYIPKTITTNSDFSAVQIKSGKLFSFLSNTKPGFQQEQERIAGTPLITIQMRQPVSTTSRVDACVWSIPINCKDSVSAMKFLNLTFTSANICNLLSWGIEGKHYVKTDVEGIIDFPQGVDATNSGYNMNMGWEFGSVLGTSIWKGDSPDLWKDLDQFNKSAVLSKACGFLFDNTSVKNEVVACTNVKNQYAVAIGDGVVDPDTEIPKFVSELKAAGLDKIISEKQRQFDDWLKSKN